MPLDIDYVRAQFPAFQEPSLQGQALFENAGGSYACGPVIDRLTRYYRQRKVQPYGPYPASRLAGEEMDEARHRLAALLNVGADTLSFGPSTTQNTYVLAQAFRQMLTPGDVVIVSNQDHEANTGPWRRLADSGIEIREWQVDPITGALDPAKLATLLDPRARLVCFPHCSNILGQINPVANLCEMIHQAGALACVDGVSFAPHGLPDIDALGADIYLFSSYKTYGPHQGVMTIRRDLADRLPNQAHYFNSGSPVKRFTPAGPDHAQIAACAGMVDYIDGLARHHGGGDLDPAERGRQTQGLMRAHETALLEPLLDYVSQRDDLRLLGPTDAAQRVPTVALVLKQPADAIAARLADHGIMTGSGDFYAVRLLEALGVNLDQGVLRLSFVHYTRADEIDQLMRALDAAL